MRIQKIVILLVVQAGVVGRTDLGLGVVKALLLIVAGGLQRRIGRQRPQLLQMPRHTTVREWAHMVRNPPIVHKVFKLWRKQLKLVAFKLTGLLMYRDGQGLLRQ